MTRFLAAALLAIMLVASAADAQQRTPSQPRKGPPVVTFAKWSLLGVAAGLGLYALEHSTRAENAYADLRDICLATPSRCEQVGGRYPDRAAEGLYNRALTEDRQAQMGIFGGQATLFASVGLFIYDLRDDRTPTTIPYPGRGGGGGGGGGGGAKLVLATVTF